MVPPVDGGLSGWPLLADDHFRAHVIIYRISLAGPLLSGFVTKGKVRYDVRYLAGPTAGENPHVG